jgi:hypothetical protein
MTDPLTAREAKKWRDDEADKSRLKKPAGEGPNGVEFRREQDATVAVRTAPMPPRRRSSNGGDTAPAFSDEALALLFAERHANDLRFVAEWTKWLSWAGTHWRSDNTLHAFDLARRTVREEAATCNKTKDARLIASAKTVAAVERLSKSDRRLAATIEQWDVAADIFNTQENP